MAVTRCWLNFALWASSKSASGMGFPLALERPSASCHRRSTRFLAGARRFRLSRTSRASPLRTASTSMMPGSTSHTGSQDFPVSVPAGGSS